MGRLLATAAACAAGHNQPVANGCFCSPAASSGALIALADKGTLIHCATLQIGGSMLMSEPDCQCSLWTTQPGFLATQSVPRGFCGRCEVCGQPGHIRHFPGSSPSTGAWCEHHYRRLAWLHPMGRYGRLVYAGATIALWLAYMLWTP